MREHGLGWFGSRFSLSVSPLTPHVSHFPAARGLLGSRLSALIQMLENPVSPRLLKKVQTPILRMGTRRRAMRGVLSQYVAAPREARGTHRRWVTADGPFSAAY